MEGVTHIAIGMLAQKRLRKPWLYAPLAFVSHGCLDASVIFHNFPAAMVLALAGPAMVLLWFARKKRLWQGAVFAVIPELDWVANYIMQGSTQPTHWWNMHDWLQKYPRWNWHGLYGHSWGILVELALLVATLILIFELWHSLGRARRHKAFRVAGERQGA